MRKNSPYLLRSVRDAELTISAPDGTKAKGSSPSNQRASAEPHQEGCRIAGKRANDPRSEEHTSELQSLMRISYADFCLTKHKPQKTKQNKTFMMRHKDTNKHTYNKTI